MEELLKKYLWVGKLGGLAVAVAFAGSAVVTGIGTRRAMAEDAAATLPDRPADDDEDEPRGGTAGEGGPNRAAAKSEAARFLVANSLFCPSCRPDEPEAAPTSATGPIKPGEIKSSLPLALIATMESDDPLYSLATIQDTEKKSLGSFGLEDEVRPGVKLVEVTRGRIVVLNGRQREFIEVGSAVPDPPATPMPQLPEARKEAKVRSPNDRKIEGAEDAIKCEGDRCTVEREFLDKVLTNPALLAKQARVVPSIKDGETQGFKFYGVRAGSLPKLLGVKSGDLVKSVNGQKLTSVDEAMGMYAKMRRASNITVEIDRRGKSVTKEITVK